MGDPKVSIMVSVNTDAGEKDDHTLPEREEKGAEMPPLLARMLKKEDEDAGDKREASDSG